MSDSVFIEKKYALSRERYADLGIDTEKALTALGRIPISLHCRRDPDKVARGPGNVPALREDIHEAFRLIPGPHRLGLRAVHAQSPESPPDRNALEPSHFRGWVDWAKQEGLKLDFSAACYGHPMAGSGFTLSHPEKDVRRFWIEHVRRCRKISAFIGRELKAPCVHSLDIPDGAAADAVVDRWARRERLRESLDEIFETEHSPTQMKDALECRSASDEEFMVASQNFCLGYAMSRGKLLGLDIGPRLSAASAADRISAILQFSDDILVRFSGDFPWTDAGSGPPADGVLALAREIVRGGALDRVHLGLEDPGAGSHRAAAWAAGGRALGKALLLALIGPQAPPAAFAAGLQGLPFGAVWEEHCLRSGAPPSRRGVGS